MAEPAALPNGHGDPKTNGVKGVNGLGGKSRAAELLREANGSRAGKGHARKGSVRAAPVKLPIPSPPRELHIKLVS